MSNITPELLKENKEKLKCFLQEKPIPIEYKIQLFDKLFGYIYCIENLKTTMKYIGSVYSGWIDIKNPHPYSSLRKRASHYIYEYNSSMRQESSIKNTNRPIIKAMCEYGFENFIMYPIAETTNKNHAMAERYFINKYNTIDNGYNTIPGRGYNKHNGRKLSKKDKLIRSDPIIAINLNHKEIIFSDSMKLFADFLGTSKDIIKNNNRSGRSHMGWFIFYINDEKRHYVLNHYVIQNNLGVQKRGNPRYHSEKSKQFYLELFNNISSYIKDPYSELFSEYTKLDRLEYIDD